jgi:cation transport ATPase
VWASFRIRAAPPGRAIRSPPGSRAAADRRDLDRTSHEQRGLTVGYVGWRRHVRGALAIGDVVKPEAEAVIGELHDLGIHVALLTGDNAHTANAIASELGIDRVLAEVLPEDKVDEVRRLQAEARSVAMVGDGINDAPALVQADLGVAIGTDVAIESSDITLISGDLEGVVTALALSRRTMRTIRQNLAWAFGYRRDSPRRVRDPPADRRRGDDGALLGQRRVGLPTAVPLRPGPARSPDRLRVRGDGRGC